MACLIRVAVRRDDRLAHELPRYRTGKFISQHLMGPERTTMGRCVSGGLDFGSWWCAAVVASRGVGHGQTMCGCVAPAVF